MAFLSSETLKTILREIVTPYDESRIKHAGYELSVGSEFYITSKQTKSHLEQGQQIVIPPGQFAFLITEESVSIPPNLIAFISIKAGVNFRGLVNISGFHVDPGFSGKLKFAVFNAGSQNVVLSRGQSLFIIWFSQLDKTTVDIYKGRHNNQNSISTDDVMLLQGDLSSPAALKKSLNQLEERVNRLNTTVRILISIGLVLLALFVTDRISGGGNRDTPSYQILQNHINLDSTKVNKKEKARINLSRIYSTRRAKMKIDSCKGRVKTSSKPN